MNDGDRERAKQPEDLSRLFLERANAGDVDGVVALYEADAALASPPGRVTIGLEAIRKVYEELLATRPVFIGDPLAAMRVGDLFQERSASVTAAMIARRPIPRRYQRHRNYTTPRFETL